MRKLLGTAALSIALMMPMLAQAEAPAQAPQVTEDQWTDIRGFLERNPKVITQLEAAMARELAPNQLEMDAAYIADHAADLYEDADSAVLGNPDGDILVVKFSDFHCGYCRKVTPELEKLIESNPRVKLIIKELPILGPDSVEAAKFAISVNKLGGSQAYQTVQDEFFGNPGVRITGYYLEDLAEKAGVDPKVAIEGMDSPDVAAEIAQTRELADGLKISGTPAILIGDIVARGALPLEAMEQGVRQVYGE